MGFQKTIIYRLVVRNLSYDAYFLFFGPLFVGKWSPNPAKKLVHWVDLLDQPLKSKIVKSLFSWIQGYVYKVIRNKFIDFTNIIQVNVNQSSGSKHWNWWLIVIGTVVFTWYPFTLMNSFTLSTIKKSSSSS